MGERLKRKWLSLLLNFKPISPDIQPTHVQSWDAQPKRRKK